LFTEQPLFSARLSIAILSVRPSSVTRVDQSKTVQARITKSSPSAAWKTLVLVEFTRRKKSKQNVNLYRLSAYR